MTTLAQRHKHDKPAILAGFILLLAMAVFFAWVISRGISFPTVAIVKPIPQIQYQPHAVERHGSDALAIRKCLNDKGGADEIWRSFDKKTFIYGATCQIIVGDLWQSYRMPLTDSGMKVHLSSKVMELWELFLSTWKSLVPDLMVPIPGNRDS